MPMAGRPRVSDDRMLAFARRYAIEHYGTLRGGTRWDRWAKVNGAPLNPVYSQRFPGGIKRVAEMTGAVYITQESIMRARYGARKFLAWREGRGA